MDQSFILKTNFGMENRLEMILKLSDIIFSSILDHRFFDEKRIQNRNDAVDRNFIQWTNFGMKKRLERVSKLLVLVLPSILDHRFLDDKESKNQK